MIRSLAWLLTLAVWSLDFHMPARRWNGSKMLEGRLRTAVERRECTMATSIAEDTLRLSVDDVGSLSTHSMIQEMKPRKPHGLHRFSPYDFGRNINV